LLKPVLASAFALIFLKEIPSQTFFVGLVFVFVGSFLIMQKNKTTTVKNY
jgi:drug/metabolite transporter (DMT)-like permease